MLVGCQKTASAYKKHVPATVKDFYKLVDMLSGCKYTFPSQLSPVRALGLQNRDHCVFWLEVINSVPNRVVVGCSVSHKAVFFCLSFVFLVYVVLFPCFGCQYQCNQLSGKTRLRNDLLCVDWDVKAYTLTPPS